MSLASRYWGGIAGIPPYEKPELGNPTYDGCWGRPGGLLPTYGEEWIIDIRDQCRRHDVPFFFKQWGGINKKQAGRRLQGRLYNEVPHCLRREHPQISLSL